MSSSKPPKTSNGAADVPGLQTLLALPLGGRRDAVAKDVSRRAPQFSAIPAHDLANALDVPEHWRPGNEWSFTRYAPIISVEEYARYNSPASDLVYLIEEAVSAERFQQLLKHSESLDESDDPSFAFLTKGRRPSDIFYGATVKRNFVEEVLDIIRKTATSHQTFILRGARLDFLPSDWSASPR
ncbi:MAG: hypothetical protein KA945_12805 [Zoogloea sp.]|nr:hypothetical protein [Zoogloea sp.]